MDASDDFEERITIPERDGFATREENVCIIYRSVNMTFGTSIDFVGGVFFLSVKKF